MGILKIIFILSLVFGQTENPSVNTFFSSNSLSLAGAGYLNSSVTSLKHNPSIIDRKRFFSISIINYKNDISSQSLGSFFPFYHGYVALSIRNLSYGVFDSYDENKIFLGTYQASDNWLTLSYAKNFIFFPFTIGLSYNFFNSSLANYQIRKSFFTFGTNILIKKIKTTLGFSFHQLGFENSPHNIIDPNFVFSILKRLEHLPLKIFLDFVSDDDNLEFFLGGEFKISENINFQIGSSSRKFSQNIQYDFFNTVFGSTGVGIVYKKLPYSINIGSYMYGTGYLISGIQLDIQF